MDIDLSVLRMMEREKEIPFDELVEIIEQAILMAYLKHTNPGQHGHANPAGARSTWSPWLIHTVSRRPSPSNSRPGSTTSSSARPYSRRPEGTTSPPSSLAVHCMP